MGSNLRSNYYRYKDSYRPNNKIIILIGDRRLDITSVIYAILAYKIINLNLRFCELKIKEHHYNRLFFKACRITCDEQFFLMTSCRVTIFITYNRDIPSNSLYCDTRKERTQTL